LLRYYLSELAGTGKPTDPFRPKIVEDGLNWGMIDLRQDSTKKSGVCLVGIDTPSVITSSGIQLITDNLAVASKSQLDALNSALNVGVKVESNLFSDWLAEFLKNTDKYAGFCPPLKAMIDGEYRIFLGNQQVYGKTLPVYRKGTITDNFNRSNSSSLGTSSDGWAWANQYESTSIGIYSNRASLQDRWDYYSAYANTGTPSSANHYSQAKGYITTAGNYSWVGLTARHSTSARTFYWFFSNDNSSCWSMAKLVSGSFTAIVSYSTGWATPNGAVLRIEVDGSSLVGKQDGVTKVSASDSDITGNTNTGLAAYCDSNANIVQWDDFEAGDLASVTPKTSSDTGSGVDAKIAYPSVIHVKSETGTGADAKTTYPTGSHIQAEAGAGVESLLARLLNSSDTGSGADAKVDYPLAALAAAEMGAGVESLLARMLESSESGGCLDALVGGNPLADLLASDAGVGWDAVTELIQSLEKISSDTGLGTDTVMASVGLITVIDAGSGVEALISRLLSKVEAGSGIDLSSLLASVIGADETGSALEASVFLPVLVSGDVGLGSELSFLLKAIVGGDGGRGIEALKTMIETAGPGQDMRLYPRSGQAGMAGGDRQHRQSGQVSLPSKEVNL
jgi:hypothetical protein